jgi:hypothetical protein
VNKQQLFLLSISMGLLLSGDVFAAAALPTELTAEITQIKEDAAEIIKQLWPIITTVTGGFILIKLFKKGANKGV